MTSPTWHQKVQCTASPPFGNSAAMKGTRNLEQTSSTAKNYMSQLDSLRFLAVLGVMVEHNWDSRLLGDLGWAHKGVLLFFVLSGFLITGILLNCRQIVDHSSQSPMYFVRQFYARRFLRIFPIYYLVIVILIWRDIPPAREIWLWMVTYTTNIYITVHNTWIGSMGHFWTLAVEEQFYLVWPLVVLLAPRRWLLLTILLILPLSSAYRCYAYFPFNIDEMDWTGGTFTVASLDSLGIGAILSLLWHSEIPKATLQRYLTKAVLPTALTLYIICMVLYHYRIKPGICLSVGDLLAALILAWLVSSAGMGFKGITGAILDIPALRYLGKISYGIYVYHFFVPLLLIRIFQYLGVPLQVPGSLNFLLSSALTIALASLSWHLIELPIINLKRYFEYEPSSSSVHPLPNGSSGRLDQKHEPGR
jgi:peptidoglycan/LPS O-acetylase OafA/YrhL